MATLTKTKDIYQVKDLQLSKIHQLELDAGMSLEVDIRLVDKRIISTSQRKLIFALCGDIEAYSGHDKELIRASSMQACNVKSMKACSVSQANQIIEELIDFSLMNQIPLSMSTRTHESFSFNEKQMYMLILTSTCCITGKPADIHHVDRVGLGRNRDKISHLGLRVLPLCREKHVEIHTIGDNAFMDKYKVEPVKVDERIEYFIKHRKIKVYESDLKEGKESAKL